MSRSQSQHQFSQVPKANIQRSVFNRSHGYKTTLNEDYLYPIFVDEVLPGDTFTLGTEVFIRLATPLKPIMDNLYFDTQYFFVPSRLVWDNWQKFCGERTDPVDDYDLDTDYLIPTIDTDGVSFASGTIGDYFGIPIGVNNLTVQALPFRAYNLIYNEWYRDQNLQDSVTVNVDDGPDDLSDYTLLKRGKKHDYFTSCLPWPQKGPGVEIPLGDTAPVIGNGMALGMTDGTYDFGIDTSASIGSPPYYLTGNQSLYGADVGDAAGAAGSVFGQRAFGVTDDPENSGLVADLSEATAATINSLRLAFQLQKLFERDARGGTRYREILQSHFGVISPDGRLQRPEYLGGGSQRINCIPVPQTSGSPAAAAVETDTPQGNLSAYGVSSGRAGGFTKSFVEHGYIIGLASVRADLSYQQGLNRMWSRQERYDYYWPALANIGEQAVLNKEIYAQGTSADEDVFGYQERHAEYRYKPSQITGLFRSQAANSLEYWHLAQEFGALPTLGTSFIQSTTPLSRAVAVPSEPHFLLDVFFDLKCARPMPLYSVPGLIDHF